MVNGKHVEGAVAIRREYVNRTPFIFGSLFRSCENKYLTRPAFRVKFNTARRIAVVASRKERLEELPLKLL